MQSLPTTDRNQLGLSAQHRPQQAQQAAPACRAAIELKIPPSPLKVHIPFFFYHFNNNKAGWPNGKALDYESRDCRFDPCVGQLAAYHCSINSDTILLLSFGMLLVVFLIFWGLGCCGVDGR
jgi:hypothetical protein